ncbi:AN1-type zinc finger protein 4-like [Ptychodera flava]|uniref:AN1-type zinc finger protein 4-like n=1 Tax=Ptychodera flava TaxID=63121 RepID=UPI003969BF8B
MDIMELFIETLTGTAFELRVSPFETVISVKAKIQRLEGIPISQQHLIWQSTELEDDFCLSDYSITAGSTLKLVLAMRGGPINTRRIPMEDPAIREMAEYMEANKDEIWEKLPGNRQVTLLVFREGDQLNFFRVVDRGDGTLTPLSESLSGASMYNMYDEEEEEQDSPSQEQVQENDITMNKMKLLRAKMESLSLTKKKKKPRPPSSGRPKSNKVRRRKYTGHSTSGQSTLMKASPLPPVGTSQHQSTLLEDTRSKFISHPHPPQYTTVSGYIDTTSDSDRNSPVLSATTRRTFERIGSGKVRRSTTTQIRQSANSPVPASTKRTLDRLPSGKLRHPHGNLDSSMNGTLKMRPNTSSKLQTLSPARNNEVISESQRKTEARTITNLINKASKEGSVNLVRSATRDSLTGHTSGKSRVMSGTISLSQALSGATTTERIGTPEGRKPLISASSIRRRLSSSKDGRLLSPAHRLPPVSKPPSLATAKKKTTKRCFLCGKKTGLATSYTCRCGNNFCASHRYAESHNCDYDYKAAGRKLLEQSNPVVSAPKLPKI